MAVLGILARLDASDRAETLDALSRIEGVTPFSVDEPARVGILMEGDTLEQLQQRLAVEVDTVAGILATWPVFGHV